MDIIDKLNDPEKFVDAVDEAISVITFLRQRIRHEQNFGYACQQEIANLLAEVIERGKETHDDYIYKEQLQSLIERGYEPIKGER